MHARDRFPIKRNVKTAEESYIEFGTHNKQNAVPATLTPTLILSENPLMDYFPEIYKYFM